MTAGEDESMPDAMPAVVHDAVACAPRPRRRFAPQLIEETVMKTSGRKEAAPSPSGISARENDVDMTDAAVPPPPVKRRFAPIPIETTFDSYRVVRNPHGPPAELTPDTSPTTPPQLPELASDKPEPKRARRKFAPQLIETSRRAKRAGNDGPATKPTDKTDITPGTHHIYAPKSKIRPAGTAFRASTVTGASDEDTIETDMLHKLLPLPSRPSSKPHFNLRRSTRSYSYLPDLAPIPSSESDASSEESEEKDRVDQHEKDRFGQQEHSRPAKLNQSLEIPAPTGTTRGISWATRNQELRYRRESCDEESSGYLFALAAKEAEAQRQLEQAMSAFPNGVPSEGVEHFLLMDSTDDEEEADTERHGTSKLPRRKSTDPGWAAKEMRQHAEKLAALRSCSKSGTKSGSLTASSADPFKDMGPGPADPLWTTAGPRPDSRQGHIGQPDTTGLRFSPFGNPFGNPFAAGNQLGGREADGEVGGMRKAPRPPMLGGDIKYRMCPSPKQTRMEPDHPYPIFNAPRPEQKQRDTTGVKGLWRGYCVAGANTDVIQSPGAHRAPDLLATPGAAPTSGDPFATAFSASMSGSATPRQTTSTKRGGPLGARHLSSSLDERLQKEKVRVEMENEIMAEFNDTFVTETYNYLSLGYAARARDFDEELSKITGISVQELRQDDSKPIHTGFMREMKMEVNMDDDDTPCRPTEQSKASKKPARWIALKLYIHEWARQHPDFNSDGNPQAWGARARRGSWAI